MFSKASLDVGDRFGLTPATETNHDLQVWEFFSLIDDTPGGFEIDGNWLLQ